MKLILLHPRYSASADAANSAISAGNSAINSYDPTQASGAAKASSGDLFNTQMGQTKNYVNDYTKAVANNPTVTSLYNTANEMYGIPGLTKTNQYYQNKVTDAIPDAYTGARGFDISADQIGNGVASKLAYLGPQAGRAQSNLNAANTLAQGFVNAGVAQNAQNLLPIQAEAPLLQQAQGVQGQIWNTATQSEFQGLLAKMQAGVQLSQAELQRAQQLAQLEESYQQAIDTANIAQKYQVLNPAQKLVNTFTGRSI